MDVDHSLPGQCCLLANLVSAAGSAGESLGGRPRGYVSDPEEAASPGGIKAAATAENAPGTIR
jgi:hypothetical protein